MNAVTIVLADDHPLVRLGLQALLQAQADFCVVGEASDGLEALRVVEHLKPQVLVLDLQMPHLSGLPVLQQVSKRCPATRVIILSMHRDESYVIQALQHGAAAYVLKDANSTELVQAIRAVASGHRYLSPPLSDYALEAYAQKAKATALDSYATLTEREQEVLHLAAEGHNSGEIAARLFISPRTAETHRAHLMRKLGLASHTDLVRYALRRGIIPLDD